MTSTDEPDDDQLPNSTPIDRRDDAEWVALDPALHAGPGKQSQAPED